MSMQHVLRKLCKHTWLLWKLYYCRLEGFYQYLARVIEEAFNVYIAVLGEIPYFDNFSALLGQLIDGIWRAYSKRELTFKFNLMI